MSAEALIRLVRERHRPTLHPQRWTPETGWTGPMVCEECSPEVGEPELWNPEPWPCDYLKALETEGTNP